MSGKISSLDKLFLIIDGYNVLHSCGMLTRNVGPGTLERARDALIGYLHRHLSQPQRQRTTIVFDSNEPHLPNLATEAEILIEFAIDHESADDRIIELIRQHSAPRQLLVVSSDHEIQRVALARRSRTIDSDVWMDQLPESTTRLTPTNPGEKPETKGVDVDLWLNEMGLDGDLKLDLDSTPPTRKTDSRVTDPDVPNPDVTNPIEDSRIFPPGYADDLFDEDQETL